MFNDSHFSFTHFLKELMISYIDLIIKRILIFFALTL
jgi:hypothetical protein